MGDHRVDRALERYGLSLSSGDIGAIAMLATPQNRASLRSTGDSIHILWQGVCLIAAIRNRDTGPIVATFLPKDSLTAGHHKRWLKSGRQPRRGEKL